MAGLLVIGDVVTDVVALHRAPGLTPGTDTAADIVVRPGGSAANTACWAAWLGADARLLARAGFDTAAWHAAALAGSGVDARLRVDAGHPTAVVIAMVDVTGERTMLTNRGASGRIDAADWDASLLDGVSHLHVSGYTLFAEPGVGLARLAMGEAARQGVQISVDPGSAGFLREFGAERFLVETSPAGLVLPNGDEALLLAATSDVEHAARVLSSRYGTAVVKRGAAGALLARDGRLVAAATGLNVQVVDSTGAGDAFAAGYLTARSRGAGDNEALAEGCREGARAVTLVGGRPPDTTFTRFTAQRALPF